MLMFWKDIRVCDRCGRTGSMATYNDALIVQALDTPPDGWVSVVVHEDGHRKLYQFCSARCNRKYFKRHK